MTDYNLGTRKRGDSFAFTVDMTVTIDGTDVTDLTDWDPVCQFRPSPDSAEVHEPELLGVVGTVAEFGVSDAMAAAMNGHYMGEVQLTNPDADEGYGTITFPGGDGYILVNVASDVARVTA